jgi:hypothetical protein
LIGKGQSERIKEEKGNEKETVKHSEPEKRDRMERADRRGSVGELLSRCGMFCFEDSWTKKRIGKKAKRWRGWGAYEEEHGIEARKNGVDGEEIRGEKFKEGTGVEIRVRDRAPVFFLTPNFSAGY